MAKNHEPNLLLEKSMKKSKTANTSSKRKKPAKKLLTFQEERDSRLGIRLKPIDIDYLKDLGDEFIEWCRDRKERRRVSIENYYEEKNISQATMQKWRKRCSYLEGCFQQGKMILGNRLEEGLLLKEMSEKGTMWQLHHYKDRWKKMNAYQDERAKSRKDEDESGKEFNVFMTDAADLAEIIEKKTDVKR